MQLNPAELCCSRKGAGMTGGVALSRLGFYRAENCLILMQTFRDTENEKSGRRSVPSLNSYFG